MMKGQLNNIIDQTLIHRMTRMSALVTYEPERKNTGTGTGCLEILYGTHFKGTELPPTPAVQMGLTTTKRTKKNIKAADASQWQRVYPVSRLVLKAQDCEGSVVH
eukprot:3939723-Rhodomonas_salina.1